MRGHVVTDRAHVSGGLVCPPLKPLEQSSVVRCQSAQVFRLDAALSAVALNLVYEVVQVCHVANVPIGTPTVKGQLTHCRKFATAV